MLPSAAYTQAWQLCWVLRILRRFVCDFSYVARPLTFLLKKAVSVAEVLDQTTAFNALLSLPDSARFLALFRRTHARRSIRSIGDVLAQH